MSSNLTDLKTLWDSDKVKNWEEMYKKGLEFGINSPYKKEGGMYLIGIKKPGIRYKYSDYEIEEMKKCYNDIFYFIENYCYILTSKGVELFKLRDYQKRMINGFLRNRFVVLVASRQMGKTTTAGVFLLWYLIFNKNKNVLVTANKEATSNEIIDKIMFIYKNLPFFMKPGVVINNKSMIEFDNGSRIIATPTTTTSGLGFTIHLLYCDEFAYVPENILTSFWKSVYPTISAMEDSKVIITSTFNGMNLFWEIYSAAERGENDFFPMRVDWWEMPGRDEKWKEQEIKNLGSEEIFNQEYGNVPLSDSSLILSNDVLKYLRKIKRKFVFKEADWYDPNYLELYEKCLSWLNEFDVNNISNGKYVIAVDLSEGIGYDYSVINIFKIINMSKCQIRKLNVFSDECDFFRLLQVGMYRDNFTSIDDISNILLNIIESIGIDNVLVSTENNKMDTNYLMSKYLSIIGDVVYDIFAKFKVDVNSNKYMYGIKFNNQIKGFYVNEMKRFVENRSIVVLEEKTIEELSLFGIRKNKKIGALSGNDDIVSTIILASVVLSNKLIDDLINDVYENEIESDIRNEINLKLNIDDKNDDIEFLKDFVNSISDNKKDNFNLYQI